MIPAYLLASALAGETPWMPVPVYAGAAASSSSSDTSSSDVDNG